MAEKAILYDATRCTACRGCQAACKQWNENDEGEGEKTVNRGSYENPPDLSPPNLAKDGVPGVRHSRGSEVVVL